MRRSALVAMLVLGNLSWLAGAAADKAIPDFSGTWRFDRGNSTGGQEWPDNSVLVVNQDERHVHMEYVAAGREFGSLTYFTDNKERPFPGSRIEHTFARARWKKGKLVITTRHQLQMGVEGSQSIYDSEEWSLADQGKTLMVQQSDGKVIVFHKDTGTRPPAQ